MVVGRGGDTQVQLDPVEDLEVSSRHAEIRRGEDGWVVRDLDSRNGTFRNGRRVWGEERLEPGDVLRLGSDGPELRFRYGAPESEARTVGARRRVEGAGAEVDGSVTAEVKARTARAVRNVRRRWGLLAAALAAAALGAVILALSQRAGWEGEREQLLATVDSLLEEEAELADDEERRALEARVQELDGALEASRGEVRRIRGELQELEEDDGVEPEELRDLQEELEDVRQALGRQQLAAGLDFDAIEAGNRSAVALVWVEDAQGETVTGTGFAVTEAGHVVTARHLFGDAVPPPSPAQVGVQFSDSEQVFPAELLAASEAEDLAVLGVENLEGPAPTVRGINARPDTVAAGTPVASLGFPLGGASLPEGPDAAPPPARPLTSAGVIRDVGADEMEIQGFGDVGASGSPVFDARGMVVAMIYGGLPDAPEGVLAAVSSHRLESLLREAGVRGASDGGD